MAKVVFIGDEISAAGFRLAGVAVRVPERGTETTVLRAALGESELVLITAKSASRIPQAVLGESLLALSPLLLVVPDIRGETAPPDLVGRLRAQLGMGS